MEILQLGQATCYLNILHGTIVILSLEGQVVDGLIIIPRHTGLDMVI